MDNGLNLTRQLMERELRGEVGRIQRRGGGGGGRGGSRLRDDYISSDYAMQTMKLTGQFLGHDECVNTIAFNSSGSLVVSGSDDESVKIWDYNSRECIDTLYGHTTNVFTAEFIPGSNDRHVVSGGNDSDVILYDRDARISTVFTHHTMKILKISVNKRQPDCFLSCSSDGTVRMFDVRQPYAKSYSKTIPAEGHMGGGDQDARILPQMFGGGRSDRSTSRTQKESLIVDFDKDSRNLRRNTSSNRIPKTTVFSVDYHPLDGYTFATATSDGAVRLFENLRKPLQNDGSSYETTGCVFSNNGDELLATNSSDSLYLYDVKRNFAKEFNLDYFKDYSVKKRPRTTTSTDTDPNVQTSKQMRHSSDGEGSSGTSSGGNDVNNNNNNDNDEDEDGKATKEEDNDGEDVDVDSSHDDDGDDDDDDDDDDDEDDSLEMDADYIMFNQLDDDEDDGIADDDDEAAVVKTYKQKYDGHISIRTIKSCSFYGPHSEYVMTGSDDDRVFIWNKVTGKLMRVLEGHDNIVNCCVGHPWLPAIISSGLENDIFLWEADDEYPDEQQYKNRQTMLSKMTEPKNKTQRNRSIDRVGYTLVDAPSCTQQ
ncbi:hypothetical protein SAMD00019534_000980 [Acytostelium subglobosum LB1]|uniref:hypothetical protein n=1 Tax=Acytostelium subglobosum LB1 TaxID=1410327 RepID=UPI000644B749|nr:hypothetical protein SAMD00019534_000980 [Acytostelium subglobosum LB1]GAM16923.1 hypothetical protein SAMD00019534_000980 [Acytostelium subglobosum LB1]|eukprot:XP_012758985.1 hypothetical protein SAMD00019534_000980 [Acytostelium subglobosum LB1]